jgi:hypothetical protein
LGAAAFLTRSQTEKRCLLSRSSRQRRAILVAADRALASAYFVLARRR